MRQYRAIPIDKPKDSGEFVYGWLSQNPHGNFVISDVIVSGKKAYEVEVHPDTVGQATGLKDKNGADGWQGDICSNGPDKYEIKWDSRTARFYLFGGVLCKDIRMIEKMIIISTIHDTGK